MIKSVTVTNSRGESLHMKLDEPYESGFWIVNIDGLGPVQANINTTEIVTFDGSIYNSARGNERNIVMDLIFEGRDIEDIRHLTYRYFPIKGKVTVQVETDHRLCEIDGYVESNDPTIFSRKESTSISILCPSAWFKDVSEEGNRSVNFYGIDPLFEFPFSNESLSEKLIEFGGIRNSFEETFDYNGEVETGFVMTIHALGEIGDVTIYNVDTNDSMTIYADKLKALTGSKLQAGDDIIINTIKGEKSARLLRDAKYTNILNCLGRDITWFQLVQGENRFAYSTSEGSANLQLSIKVQNLFQGA